MVKITYIGKRYRSLRARKGYRLGWNKGDTIDVKDEELLKELKTSKNFVEQNEVGKKTGGGGIKTHVRPPKRRGRPSKPKAKPKAKPKKEVKSKRPKGLRKSKRAD